MKVITIARTRNEEANIERFCEEYGKISDVVLIADGGSVDKTIVLAEKFGNVFVRPFHARVVGEGGLWRNPHGEHLNFLMHWAEEEGADWIIHDDVDSVPNKTLKARSRGIMETCSRYYDQYALFVPRAYLYADDQWFPDLMTGTSRWATHVSLKARYYEIDPWKHECVPIPDRLHFNFALPAALLHDFAPDEETIQRKLKFYRNSGQHPTMLHPLEFGGRLEDLPDWAKL